MIRECFRKCVRQGDARDVVVRLRKSLGKGEIVQARAALAEMLNTVLAAK